MRVVANAVLGLLFISAVPMATLDCSTTPPARWAQGGSTLEIPRARWERSGQIVDIMPDGHVLINGVHVFSIDGAGRVIDNDNSPIAVLGPDGALSGVGNTTLGTVGLHNAAPPKKDKAWIGIADSGDVSRYDDEDDPVPDGKWTGCGTALRTCTLATQVVALAETRNRSNSRMPPVLPGPTVGFGATGGGVIVSP